MEPQPFSSYTKKKNLTVSTPHFWYNVLVSVIKYVLIIFIKLPRKFRTHFQLNTSKYRILLGSGQRIKVIIVKTTYQTKDPFYQSRKLKVELKLVFIYGDPFLLTLDNIN